MEDVIKYIKSLNIYEDDNVVLACSYGPDSMCLLDILKKLNINVIVAHVNHKYRKESDKEYNDLKKYCEDNNLSFEGKILTEEVKGNREEFYRKFRYDFFAELVKKYQAKYLFTAHHGDDLVETVLMRLSRGASFKGYAGFNIRTKINDYEIIRPLILVTKDDILNLNIKSNKIYVTNQTTLSRFDTDELISLLEQKYKNIIIDNKICNATTVRQEAVLNQPKADLCIIVGDKNSSNTNKLKEVSLKTNTPTILIDSINDLDKELLKDIKVVNITSGASTPSYIVDEIIEYLNTVK